MTPADRRRALFRPSQLVALALACLIGLLVASVRLGAAAPPPAGPAGLGGASGSAKASGSASGSTKASASVVPSTAPTAEVSASASASGSSTPLDYAVVQDDTDFPKDMTEEQKNAVGNGKVPIHREGPFRSPLAHPRFGGPAHVQVGLVLVAVRGYTVLGGSYQADFFLSLTGDKALPPMALSFTNASDVNETVLVDSPTFKLYRYRASFTSPVDLRAFPWDQQQLNIELEDLRAGADQVLFEPDKARTTLDENFAVTGWRVANIGARSYRHLYPGRFGRDDLYISRYKFVLAIQRFGTSAAFSVYVPAFIIVIIALFGMWVPFERLDVRANAGAPMLAAAVLFHYSLMQSLPATGYLTRADKIMMAVYISLLLNMGSTWTSLVIDEKRSDEVFRFFRWSVPAATALVMCLGSVT